jgi:hypothetical protein
MPRLTGTQINANVLERLGNRTDSTPHLDQWRTAMFLKVAAMFDHPELQGVLETTLPIGSRVYVPTAATQEAIWWPTNVVMSMSVSSRRRIERDEIAEVTKMDYVSGMPTRYAWYNQQFHFNRTAAQVHDLKIWYKRRPDIDTWEITAPSTLGPEYDNQIELYTAAHGLEYFREFEKAQTLKNLAEMDASRFGLPVSENRKDDHRAGFQPMTRRR